jgi:hypothetical protein
MTSLQANPSIVPIAPNPGKGSLAAASTTTTMSAPVPPAIASSGLTAPGLTKKYKPGEIFKIYESSPENDRFLNLPEKYASYASRHMAPNAPFPIKDTTDPSDPREYPSITHFLSGMKLKYASASPQLATVFTREGSIHTSFLAERAAKQKGKALSKKAHNELILTETNTVKSEETRLLQTPTTRFDEGKWAPIKDNLLRAAITQRLTSDKWFCTIVLAAQDQQKLLLYVDEDAAAKGSEMGGNLVNGKLSGQNKYGSFIETISRNMPDTLKACLALPDPF